MIADNQNESGRHLALNLYFSGLAVVLGILYMASRAGLPGAWTALPEVGSAVAIAVLAFLLPVLPRPFWKAPSGFQGGVSNLAAWLTLAILTGLSYLPINLSIVLWILAALAALAACLRARGEGLAESRSLLWGIASLLCFGILFAIVDFPRAHPPFASEQAYAGYLFDDGYYHMALTQMLIGYGVPSIGIDGLLWDPYHVGSHYLIGRLTVVTGGAVPHSYPAFMHLLFLPLLLRSLVAVSLDFAPQWTGKVNLAIGAVLAAVIIYASGINDTVFISPTYNVSLAGALAVAPWLLAHAERRITLSVWAWAGLIAAIVPLIAFKTSTGQLYALLLVYVAFRSDLAAPRKIALIVVASVVTLVFLPLFTSSQDHAAGLTFSPFLYYIMDEVLVWRRPFFFIVYSIFSLTYVGFRLWQEKAFGWPGMKSMLHERRAVDAEALLLITLAGYVPGALLYFPQLIWIYYYDFQAWLGLPLILAMAFRSRPGLDRRRSALAVPILAVLLIAPLLDVLGAYLMKRTGRFVAEIAETHAALTGEAQLPRGELGVREERLKTVLAEGGLTKLLFSDDQRLPDRTRVVTEAAADLKGRFGWDVAMYIPPSNGEYWHSQGDCFFDIMFVPAIAGIAMIDGAPIAPCGRAYYGFRPFEVRQDARDLDDAELCERTVSRGFVRVYRLESITQPERNRLLECR
jgi:hypothetical protein